MASTGGIVDGVKKYAYVWGNRCHPTAHTSSDCADTNIKGNPVITYPNGLKYRAFFTSRAGADACTVALAEAQAGASRQAVINDLAASGVALADSEAALASQAQSLAMDAQKIAFLGSQAQLNNYLSDGLNASQVWVADTCYVPEVSSAAGAPVIKDDISGIVLDYEEGDNRSSQDATQFFGRYTSAVRAASPALKLVMFNDDLQGSDTAASGLDAVSGPTALADFDLMAVFAWPGPSCTYRLDPIAKHLDDQIYELNGNTSSTVNNKKIYAIYDLRNDQDIAPDVRGYVLSHGLSGIMLWRDNSVQNSCDTSVINSARHIQDLFALPTPLSGGASGQVVLDADNTDDGSSTGGPTSALSGGGGGGAPAPGDSGSVAGISALPGVVLNSAVSNITILHLRLNAALDVMVQTLKMLVSKLRERGYSLPSNSNGLLTPLP